MSRNFNFVPKNIAAAGVLGILCLTASCSADKPSLPSETKDTTARMYDYGVPIAEARKIEGRPVVNCYTYTNKEREGKGAHCGLFENLPTNPKYTFDREVTKSVIFSNCYQSEGVILRMRAPDEDTIVKDASGYWREQLEVFNASVVREKNAKTDGRTCFQGVGATSEFFGLLETGDFKVFNIDANNPI